MRPDEHKKKKNTDYKKKHGLPLNKDTKKHEGKQGKAAGDTKDKHSSTTTKTTTTCTRLGSETKQATLATALEVPQEQQQQETRKFSRRKITNNWEKYDDLQISDYVEDGVHNVERRGADFATLLEGTGDSHSQFRFQDEKEWEGDASTSQAPQPILEINFQELSDSLKVLPLHKRLNLDEEEVNPDLQQEFDLTQDTPTIKNNVEKPPKESALRQPQDCILSDALLNASRPPMLEVKPSYNINFSLPGSKTDKENETPVSSHMHLSTKSQSTTETISNESKDVPGKNNTKVDKSNDDDLEFLLSLDNTEKYPKKQMNNQNGASKGSLAEITEDRKTDNIHTVTNNSGLLSSASGVSKQTPVPEQEEDLEDWLDSVLG